MQRFRIFLIGTLMVFAIVLFSVPALGAQDDMEQANKDVVARIIDEAFNQGVYDVFEEDFAADYVFHRPDGEGDAADFRDFIVAARAAMPDLEAIADPVIAEGDYVALRFVMTGTFENELAQPTETVQPTGEPVELIVNVIMRFNEDGQVVEEWDAFDTLSWLTQLGVLPPLEEMM